MGGERGLVLIYVVFAQSLKQPLKEATEGAVTAVWGTLFHTLVADGKNE